MTFLLVGEIHGEIAFRKDLLGSAHLHVIFRRAMRAVGRRNPADYRVLRSSAVDYPTIPFHYPSLLPPFPRLVLVLVIDVVSPEKQKRCRLVLVVV
jgi:hypothetical protein